MDVDYVAIPYNQMGVVATLDISEVVFLTCTRWTNDNILLSGIRRQFSSVATISSRWSRGIAATIRNTKLSRLEYKYG